MPRPFALLGLLVLVGFLQHSDHGPVADPHPRPVLIAAAGALAMLLLSRVAWGQLCWHDNP